MMLELLQRVGLTKYEAEAYAALLAEGQLTGYELGKRSAVPLSRSYEVLEKLVRQGLALVQPGDPPRYAAEAPERFLERLRSTTTSTLDALGAAFAAVEQRDSAGEFWVLRGRQSILARARALLSAAQQAVEIELPATDEGALAHDLAAARRRGCHCIARVGRADSPAASAILLLVDGREALAGTLEPAGHCQAVVSDNAGLLLALAGHFGQWSAAPSLVSAGLATPAARDIDKDWMAWEDRKQRRLWRSGADRVA